MANPAKVRDLLMVLRQVAPFLTDEEISDLGIIVLGALERMEKENEK